MIRVVRFFDPLGLPLGLPDTPLRNFDRRVLLCFLIFRVAYVDRAGLAAHGEITGAFPVIRACFPCSFEILSLLILAGKSPQKPHELAITWRRDGFFSPSR